MALPLMTTGARVLIGADADGLRLAFDLHLLLFNRDGERKFQLFCLAGGEGDVWNRERREARSGDGDGVGAGSEAAEGILTVGAGFGLNRGCGCRQ